MSGAIGGMDGALRLLEKHGGVEEFIAQEIRGAVVDLDSVIGRIDVEDVLDEIFSSFCLGK
jgi:tRNA modification GTPase